MRGEQHPARVQLREARETAVEQLSQSFARDELSLEEFEERLDRAYAAASREEVRALVSDLTVAQPVGGATAHAEVNTVPTALVRDRSVHLARMQRGNTAMAIFGNVERKGRFELPHCSKALAVFGNVDIDLREALIPEGTTEIHVRAIFGNVAIIVPPTLAVQCHGVSIFGNFEGLERVPVQPDGSPALRITGKAIFGNVEVSTRVRGYAAGAIGRRRVTGADAESSPNPLHRLPPPK